MAKSKGSTSASKMPDTNAKLGEIFTAAKSTMEPKSYEEGYPIQSTAVYPGKFGLSRGKRGG